MDAATVALITTLIQLAIKYVPEMIEQGTLAINLLTKTEALTDEEKAQVLAASTAAHEALQKRCDEQLATAEAAGITE